MVDWDEWDQRVTELMWHILTLATLDYIFSRKRSRHGAGGENPFCLYGRIPWLCLFLTHFLLCFMPCRYVVEVCVCVCVCVCVRVCWGVAASVIINHFENNPERIGTCRDRWETLACLLALNDIVWTGFFLVSVFLQFAMYILRWYVLGR